MLLVQFFKKQLIKNPLINEFLRRRNREKRLNSYFRESRRIQRVWISQKTEFSNYYYNLTDLNLDYLASYVSIITQQPKHRAIGYFEELRNNDSLHSHIFDNLFSKPEMKDSVAGYGRRIAWYAFIRELKPKIVVETGVYQGLGSCIILAALQKNAEEGFSGEYIGIDIDLNAGQLFSGPYNSMGKLIFGDSIKTLEKIEQTIDIFISDSDHSSEYEFNEYLTIQNKISPKSLLISDNAHSSISLSRFSELMGRDFLFFKEEPKDHWYPGAGIGCSFYS